MTKSVTEFVILMGVLIITQAALTMLLLCIFFK